MTRDECTCGYDITLSDHNQCRRCRNPGRRGYVSPDRAERQREALDYAEQENRQRIVDNKSNE